MAVHLRIAFAARPGLGCWREPTTCERARRHLTLLVGHHVRPHGRRPHWLTNRRLVSLARARQNKAGHDPKVASVRSAAEETHARELVGYGATLNIFLEGEPVRASLRIRVADRGYLTDC